MTTHYEITVIGKAWQGFKSVYVKKCKFIPADIESEFGDFEAITDHQIVKVTREVEHESVRGNSHRTITSITEEIVKAWSLPDSADYADPVTLNT